MAATGRMSPVERLLMIVTFSSFLLSSAYTVGAMKTPSYTDVFQYNWKTPTGETYECKQGWKARGVTCYKVYTEELSWPDAKDVCSNYGGQLAKVEELNTNIYIGNEVDIADSTIGHYWIGFTREGATGNVGHWSDGTETDTVIGHWMTDQPDDKSGKCVKVNNDTDQMYLWSMHWCGDKLPFVCQRMACLQGEFQCSNGRCIKGAWRHDGEDDCGDMSDEVDKPGSCISHIKIQSSEKIISSPKHPSKYDSLTNCIWILEGPVGKKLQLTFEIMNTEENIDIVDVYVGGSTIAASDYVTSLSGLITGDNLPTYVSTNNFMIVRFTSDKSVQKSGFKATFTTDYACKMGELKSFGQRDDTSPLTTWTGKNADECKRLCLDRTDCDAFTYVTKDNKCIAHKKIVSPKKAECCSYWAKTCPGQKGEPKLQTIPGAGGSIKASKDLSYLASPFYPLKYFSNNKLAWIISAPKFSIITIERLDVDFGAGDSVTIYDGDKPTDPQLTKYTGDGSDGLRHVMTTGAAAYIYMDTKSSEAGRGFQFSYKIGCDVTLEDDSGVIHTPGYGVVPYPNMVKCTWTIKASASIRLRFKKKVTLKSGDSLKIYEGIMEKHSGAETPVDDITAESGKLVIHFSTDATVNGDGFYAEYSIACQDPPFNSSSPGFDVASSLKTHFGASIVVKCKPGYFFSQEEYGECPSGSSHTTGITMTCERGGKWDKDRFPMCERGYCGAVHGVEHGYIENTTSVLYEGLVTYKCFEGFELSKTNQIKCLVNREWDSRPTCKADVCTSTKPVPGTITNGKMNANADNKYGSVVKYECDEGYQIDEGVPRTYCKGKTWKHGDVVATCTGKPCLVPEAIPHAEVSNTNSRVVLFGGPSVTVTCNIGYGINGSTQKTQTIVCKADQTFEEPDPCQDLDECNSTNSCDHNCQNTEGSYICSCKQGYTLMADKPTCKNIDECTVENGGCSDTCTDSSGGYSCSCLSGYTLYLGDNFNGFGDTSNELDINHTCVRKTCDKQPPSSVTDGKILFNEQKKYFYYGDQVEILCQLGYVINDGTSSNNNSKKITCQSDKTWDSDFLNCTAATCERLSNEQLSKVKKPPTVIYPAGDGPVTYDTEVQMNCSVAGGEDSVRTRTCLYNVAVGKYQLIGDSLECGQIDCGSLKGEVAGLKTDILPSTTTYEANFIFECEPGFTITGTNGRQDKVVKCMETGKWDLGGLRCVGPVCKDPGRPADGKQIATSYEVGKTVTFECPQNGFEPEPPSVVCVSKDNGVNAQWNDTRSPTCVDREKPKFTPCPTKSVYVQQLEIISVTPPTVTDNSGAIASLTVSYNLNRPVTKDANIMWTATDHQGNEASSSGSCVVEVHVKDERLPNITCPESGVKYVDAEDTQTTETVTVTNGTAAGSKHIVTNIVSPSTFTLSKNDLYKVINLKQEATDDQGYKTVCSFQYVIKPKPCQKWALRQPKNGEIISCTNASCELQCNSGYTFYNQSGNLQYDCTEGSSLNNSILGKPVPDCTKPNIATFKQVFVLQYAGTVITTKKEKAYKTEIESRLSDVQTDLQNQCSSSMTTTPPTVELSQTVTLAVVGNTVDVTFSLSYKKNNKDDDIKTCAGIVKDCFEGVKSRLGADKLKDIQPSELEKITVAKIDTFVDKFTCPEGELLQSQLCVPCPSGYYKNNSGCELCPKGTYNDQPSQASCKPCQGGTYTYTEGSVREDLCYVECPRGLVSKTRLPPCSACPPHTFWKDATTCVDCPNNRTFTRGPQGGADIEACKAECSPGNFSYDGREPCRPCPIGFYQAQSGQKNCIACSGKTTAQTGSTSMDNCTATACIDNFCENEGTCDLEDNLYPKCTCAAGYTGVHCETDIDECASTPCYYGGNCTDGVNSYTCDCPKRTRLNLTESSDRRAEGASDDYKDNVAEGICKELCSNNTQCVAAMYQPSGGCYIYYSKPTVEKYEGDTVFMKVEVTTSAYSGPQCEEEENNCEGGGTKCYNGGMCKDEHLDFSCLCRTTANFTGKWCHEEKTLCVNKECQNGGTCQVISDIRYTCKCAAGYTGQNCETDIDDCAEKPCLYGGTCTDKKNDFYCTCPTGFDGKKCEKRPKEGSLCSPDPCGGKGTCVEDYSTSKAHCICEPGYTSGRYKTLWLDASDPDATGDDETLATLKQKWSICGGTTPVEAICRVKGSDKTFSEGDSTNQAQEVACSTAGLLCLNSNQTINTTCDDYQIQFECDAGGSQCVNIDMCAEEKCENGATCSDNSGREGVYQCSCVSGFTGYNCQHNIDECASNPCQNGATCNDMVNGYNCTCLPGYTGVVCKDDIDECMSNPCDPDKTKTEYCKDLIDSYECICQPGYKGINCSEDYDECVSQPCLHGGTCENRLNDFSCNCSEGWTGKRCETMISYCSPDPCQNGATCHDVFQDYFCQCAKGYDGRNCEKGPNLCTVANPCQNGGTCYVKDGVANCNCSQHFTGDGCQCAREYCSETNNICQNGGSCSVTSTGGFSCSCQPGFMGDECETNIDDCPDKGCPKGTCIDGVEKAFCQCPVGKVGSTCNKDIERDVDIVFDGRGGAYSLHTFQVNASLSSLGVWVRYADKGGSGMFLSMHMVKSQTAAEVTRTLVSMNETSVEMSFSTGDDVSLKYPLGTHVNNGNWHYVTLSLEDNKVTLYLDGTTGDSRSFTPVESVYVVLRVGGSEPERFHGVLSLVQVWDVARNDTEIISVLNKKATPITSQSYTEGLIADWSWDSFQPGPGMKKMSPSTRGETICSSGQQLDKDGNTCIKTKTDKLPPPATCPSEDVGIVAERRLVEVDFTEPTFTGQHTVAKNHKSGGVFQIGISPVVYSASDPEGNRAMCAFNVFLRKGDCETPDKPTGGMDPVCNYTNNLIYKRCTVKCDTDKAFLRPVPKFFSCGPIGLWNTNSPMEKFRLPPCGHSGTIKKHVQFGWDFDLVADFRIDTANTMTTNLHQKFLDWNKKLKKEKPGTPFCVKDDCSDISITVKSHNKDFRIKVDVDRVAVKVGKDWPVVEAVTQEVLLNHGFDLFNMPGAKDIDVLSFWIEEEVSCDDDYQAVGDKCVKCTVGTFYNNVTKTCDDCPIGSYRDDTGTVCVTCQSGNTTETTGSTSHTDCIDLCESGNFYNKTSGSCVPCAKGYYQPDKGRTYCLACAIGKTTGSEKATKEANCFDDCPSGKELKPDGSCKVCEVGSYRKQGVQSVCTPCPGEKTTPGEGGKGKDACSLVKCSVGHFRVGEDPGTCLECPRDSYRNASMDNCTSCGDSAKWRTEGKGKTSQDDCKFYCPAGTHIAADGQSCEGCPKNTYKPKEKYHDYNCTACPQDTPRTTSVNSTALSDCRLGNCTTGEILKKDNLEQCVRCGYDKYQPVLEPDNTTKCIPCGKTNGLDLGTKQEKTANKSQCLPYCPAGEELVSGKCEVCQRGFYKSNDNKVARFDKCKACHVDFITEATEATHKDNCTRGNCSAGYKTVGKECEPCPVGTYQPEKWQDKCTDCPKGSTTKRNQSISEEDCNVYPDQTRFTFSLTLGITWDSDFNNPDSAAYKELTKRLVKSIDYLFEQKLSDIYKKDNKKGSKLLGFSKGSVVAALETQFDKKEKKSTEVVELVQNVLTTAVKSGQLPDIPGFKPLKTIKTALPQVAVIPDGAKSCERGEQLNKAGSDCEACPVGYYQPNKGEYLCYKCPSGYSTADKGGIYKEISCKDMCTVYPNYCQHEGTCTFDTYGMKPICRCRDRYKGDRCETLKDPESDVPLISGLVIGLVALLFIIMFIAVSFSYRKRMRVRKERVREDRERELMVRRPNMTQALPAASVFGGYTQRSPLGSAAPWSQPGQYMFYNDDVDEPAGPAQYPTFHQTSAVFQRH